MCAALLVEFVGLLFVASMVSFVVAEGYLDLAWVACWDK